jgi:hypothetical protein
MSKQKQLLGLIGWLVLSFAESAAAALNYTLWQLNPRILG